MSKDRHRRHANPLAWRSTFDLTQIVAFAASLPQPLALDVGSGSGLFACGLAKMRPQWHVLAIELRPHLCALIRQRAKEAHLSNISVWCGNFNRDLLPHLPPASVAFCAFNFPDPWYKRRHHKRRILQPESMPLLQHCLQVKGMVYTMTDYAPLLTHMQRLLHRSSFLEENVHFLSDLDVAALHSERELLHATRGEPIYRLCYQRRDEGFVHSPPTVCLSNAGHNLLHG